MADRTERLRRERDRIDEEIARREALAAARKDRAEAAETLAEAREAVEAVAEKLAPVAPAAERHEALIEGVEESEGEEVAAMLRPALEERVQRILEATDEAVAVLGPALAERAERASHVGDDVLGRLNERMKRILEAADEAVAVLEPALAKRAERAIEVAGDVLSRLEDGCRETEARFAGRMGWQWLLRPSLLLAAMFVVVLGGTASLSAWWAAGERARQERTDALDTRIAEQRETVAALEADTWGIALREVEGQRFVVLPAGALDDPPWTVSGRPAVRLGEAVTR